MRYPGRFDYVEVYDKFEVTISQGPEYKVEITCGEHIIKNITSEVSDGILRLDNINKCNFVRGYKRVITIRITTPYVVKVSHFGVGTITMSPDFKQDQIFFRAENSGDTYINGSYDQIRTSSHGDGDMYISGQANQLMIYSYGTNYTWAESITVKDYIYISTYSIGNAYFNLNGVGGMDYLIWSDGNIYYKGMSDFLHNLNPSETSAKGKAIQD